MFKFIKYAFCVCKFNILNIKFIFKIKFKND